MKKLLMVSALFLVGALSVSAQTYRYRQTTKVDPDGVKCKGLDLIEYFTFSGNLCYESDKDGNLRKSIAGEDNSIYKYKYVGTSNGIKTYEQITKVLGKGIWGETLSIGGYSILYVSSDNKRINKKDKKSGWIDVYENEEPQREQAPTQLY